MEEVKAYKCGACKHTYDSESDALGCEFKHARYYYANALLEKGWNLRMINYACGFNWTLTKEQEEITKDSCFVISHWQCCEKPAYQIISISDNGYLYVSGKGSWSGYYGHDVRVDEYYMKKPYPKEELFIDKR
jgi:hypothetical protein